MFKVIHKTDVFNIDSDSLPWIIVRILNDNDVCINTYTLESSKGRVELISAHSTKGAADKAILKINKQSPKLPTNEEKKFTYQLSLTETQAQLLVRALDFYSRIGMGQLGEVAHVLRLNSDTPIDKINAVADMVREAAGYLMGSAGTYFGICSSKISDSFRIAWDLQQVIRHRLAWDKNPQGGIQVNFDEPIKSSKEPLALFIKVMADK